MPVFYTIVSDNNITGFQELSRFSFFLVPTFANRIILEAKRYLYYTDKRSKEIAYELGFENPEHFSRFFKLNTGKNISAFRKEDKNAS